jgi:hypothetical protein
LVPGITLLTLRAIGDGVRLEEPVIKSVFPSFDGFLLLGVSCGRFDEADPTPS